MNEKDQLNNYIDDPQRHAAPDAATRQVVDQLRQQAEQVEPRPQFVHELSGRLQAEARQTKSPRSLADWLVLRFVPRVVGVTAVVGLIALIAWGGPKLWQAWANPQAEPVHSGDAIPVADRAAPPANPFPAAPAELPLYQLEFEPLPTTAAEAVAWAADFGIPDPKLFTDPRQPGMLQVIGSNDESLAFQGYGPGSIYYSSGQEMAQVAADEEPVSFAAATDSAIDFLAAHDLLPDRYQVVEGGPAGQGPMRTVYVLLEPAAGYALNGQMSGVGINLTVGPDGRVWYGNFTRVQFTPGEMVAIIPAQAAYDAYQAGELTSFAMETSMTNPATTPFESFSPPPPVHQIGDEVEVRGWPNVLVAAAGDEVRATLYGQLSPGIYHLVGDKARELTDPDLMMGDVVVRGVITAVIAPGEWELTITEWEAGRPSYSSYAPFSCLKGAVSQETDGGWLTTDEGDRYRLPDAPDALSAGDRIEVCAETPPETGEVLTWQNITRPPASEAPMSEGGVSMMTSVVEAIPVPTAADPMVVEEMVETTGSDGSVTVERSVISVGGGGAGMVASGAFFLSPDSPEAALVEAYGVGAPVVLTGTLNALIFERKDGSQDVRAQLQLLNEQGLIAGNVPLTAADETLLALAEYHGRFVQIDGILETSEEWPGIALAVEGYTAVWPDAALQNFLGHIELETMDGVETAVFVDHASDQRYLIAWGNVYFGENDPIVSSPQILITGLVYPGQTETGLPSLILHSSSHDSYIAQASDVSEFPLESKAQVIPYSPFNNPVATAQEMVLERMELVYYYEPAYDHTAVSANTPFAGPPPLTGVQTARPVWLIHGRSPDGATTFKIYIPATGN
ncbi:MAG: hypothetical protein KF770_00070 [Anaerolineae bacterium]|nr:hypothetical protein [Anaerolineae bacterium]